MWRQFEEMLSTFYTKLNVEQTTCLGRVSLFPSSGKIRSAIAKQLRVGSIPTIYCAR